MIINYFVANPEPGKPELFWNYLEPEPGLDYQYRYKLFSFENYEIRRNEQKHNVMRQWKVMETENKERKNVDDHDIGPFGPLPWSKTLETIRVIVNRSM